jgi:hypothetical protein
MLGSILVIDMESKTINEQLQEAFKQRLSQTRHEISEFIQLADTHGYRALPPRDNYRYSEDKKTIIFTTAYDEYEEVGTILVNTHEEDGRESILKYYFFGDTPFKSFFNGVEKEADAPLGVQDLEDIDALIKYVNSRNELNKLERDRRLFLKELGLKAVELATAERSLQQLLKDVDPGVMDSLAGMNEPELNALVIQAVTKYGAGEMYAREQYLFDEIIKTLQGSFWREQQWNLIV